MSSSSDRAGQNRRELRVFLSYVTEDREEVESLYHRLKRSGFAPWLDKADLIPGRIWSDEIELVIETADAVLVCLSPNSNRAGHMQAEIRRALEVAKTMPAGRVYLVPVRLQDCDPPGSLEKQRIQWVDLYEVDGYERLVTALNLCAKQVGSAESAQGDLARDGNVRRLSGVLDGHLRLHRILGHDEQEDLIDEGRHRLPPELGSAVAGAAEDAASHGWPNDPHAVLTDPRALEREPLNLRFTKLTYHELVALDRAGEKPPTLTANVVICDPSRQQLMVHWRSPNSRLYPSTRSVFGGAYAPDMGAIYDRSLWATARREFNEESGQDCCPTYPPPPRLLSVESQTGAVQVNFLGARAIEVPGKPDPSEGDPHRIGFSRLEQSLLDTGEWAPLGWGCILAWLAVGAPAANATFNGKSPQQVFDDVLTHVEEHGYVAPPVTG